MRGDTIIVRKLEFDGLIIEDVEPYIGPEMEVPLRLGFSAIGRLGEIQIDPKGSTLTIIK
tara:strand:+ start:280 stop:459 length:180 start_codon:yes stop_codon:yes gene_type:complete